MPGVLGTDAGSDLASLKMSAVRDGDCYVVNGQKTWNTLGNLANWCELLVRTDPHAPKHKGISCLLVDMARPGIEVRPLVTITGELGFNEIFFTDVRVPTSALLGEENEGWRVATTTLAYERGGVASLHLGLRAKIRRLLDEAKVTPMGDGRTAAQDPVLRQRLARVYLEGELLELIADRALSGAMHGRELGPESSIATLVWSETEQHLGEVAGDVLGADANSGEWGRTRVAMRSYTIAGGTTQVNKNVLAQRSSASPAAERPPLLPCSWHVSTPQARVERAKNGGGGQARVARFAVAVPPVGRSTSVGVRRSVRPTSSVASAPASRSGSSSLA